MLKHAIQSSLFALSLIWGVAVNAQEADDMVNINTASAETLDKELKYVGEKTADRIVAYREENGNFASIDELSDVKGVGSKTIEANRDIIILE